MMSVYNAQYNDYQQVAATPDLSEDQKVILRVKRKTLTDVYPLIQMYISYSETGEIPIEGLEQSIMDHLNSLLLSGG